MYYVCLDDIMFRDEPAYSMNTEISKDIFDFLGLHGDWWILSGAVTVCLYHQHQQIALWYLLHYKHPETHNGIQMESVKTCTPIKTQKTSHVMLIL